MACQVNKWVQVGLYVIRTDKIVCVRFVRPKPNEEDWNVAILYDNPTVKSINHKVGSEEEAIEFVKAISNYEVLVDYK